MWIHFEALKLAAKGLAFTPNTGWSALGAAPSTTGRATAKGLASSRGGPSGGGPSGGGPSGGGCPVFGSGARSSPLFLERAGLLTVALALSALVAAGALSRPAALALALAAYAATDALTQALPPDITGNRRVV